MFEWRNKFTTNGGINQFFFNAIMSEVFIELHKKPSIFVEFSKFCNRRHSLGISFSIFGGDSYFG